MCIWLCTSSHQYFKIIGFVNVFFYREEVGPDAARKFLGHTQWLVNYWLLQNAFSIGIGDTIADASTMEKINETISTAKEDVKKLIVKAQNKDLEPEPGRTMMESFENKVNQVPEVKLLKLSFISGIILLHANMVHFFRC